MKVGIILSPYGIKNPSGLSRFILNLTHEIVRASPEDTFVICVRGSLKVSEFSSFTNVEIKCLPNNIFWKDIAYIRNLDIDVWLYNNLGLPLVIKPEKSLAIALDFGNFYDFETHTLGRGLAIKAQKILNGSALRRASRVVCISESTRMDIKRFFPKIPLEKVSVVMSGYTPPKELLAGEIPNINLPNSFYLLVGVIKSRKNQITALKAFFLAREKGLNSHLVITGKGEGEYFEEFINLIEGSPFKQYVHYIGYRSEEEMSVLYKQTRALLIPSRVEGFGMPIVEAMSSGTPVIISSHQALKEVAGEAAIVAEIDSSKDFAEAMLTLSDESVRATLIEKGLQQAKKFSWEKSALGYLSEFRNIRQE